jgi:hypothetical protein
LVLISDVAAWSPRAAVPGVSNLAPVNFAC